MWNAHCGCGLECKGELINSGTLNTSNTFRFTMSIPLLTSSFFLLEPEPCGSISVVVPNYCDLIDYGTCVFGLSLVDW